MFQERGHLASSHDRVGSAATIMICSEREQLLRSYHAAVTAYADVASRLKNAGAKEFPKQFALADQAREKCDRLQQCIDNHRATQGC